MTPSDGRRRPVGVKSPSLVDARSLADPRRPFRVRAGRAGLKSRPWLSSRARCGLVAGGVGDEVAIHTLSLMRRLSGPHGFLGPFAFSDLAVVVGLAGAVVAHLHDRREVHGMVELTVASLVQPVTHGWPARGLDRGRGVVAGVRSAVAKRATLPVWPKMRHAAIGPIPKMSVTVVSAAVTAATIRTRSSARSRSTLRNPTR